MGGGGPRPPSPPYTYALFLLYRWVPNPLDLAPLSLMVPALTFQIVPAPLGYMVHAWGSRGHLPPPPSRPPPGSEPGVFRCSNRCLCRDITAVAVLVGLYHRLDAYYAVREDGRLVALSVGGGHGNRSNPTTSTCISHEWICSNKDL